MKLGKLCAVIFSGGTPNTSNTEYWNGEFHWLSSGETRNTYIFNTEKTITQKGVDNSSTRLAKKNDVVIASAGQGKTRGQVSYCMIDTYINQSLISMRTNPKLLDPKFLFYNLTSRYNELRTLSDSSSSRGSLTIPILENIDILLPPLKQQKTIATILSNYDDLIENNNTRIKILEEMAQKIYKEWFVDFKYPGHETATFKDTELGKIPSDWEVKTIEDVISDIESGSRPKGGIVQCNSGIPSIGAENIIGLGKYDYSKEKLVTNEFYNKMKKGKIKSLDVLLYKDGAQIGRKSMFGEGFPYLECCINEHVFILRTNTKCSQYYLYFTLDLPEYTEKIKQLNTNAAQPGINQQQVKGIQIRLAPISIINKFDEIVKPIISLIFNLCIRNKELMQTRDLLLPRLISGEIDVEHMEIN